MTDDPVASCQTCEAPVRRVFHPVAVHFKGSGFYNTDYGKAKRSGASESSSETKSSDDKSSSDTKKSESKSSSKSSDD
jgi:predicted nucleic acid-binding Zn ribbon protein